MRVYQAALKLEQEVLLLVAVLPRGTARDVDQLCRALGSLLLNIAEAFGCEQPGRKQNHLEIARGSSDEVRAALRGFVARGIISDRDIRRACELTSVIAKMLTSWIKRAPDR